MKTAPLSRGRTSALEGREPETPAQVYHKEGITMNSHVEPSIRSILNSFFCIGIGLLPQERGDPDYDAPGRGPDDTGPFGGEAA
jgi:hypothetical protein